MSDFMAYDADDDKPEPDDEYDTEPVEQVEPIESIEPTEGPVDSTFGDDDGGDSGQPEGANGAEPAAAAAPPEPADERNWFVIHCYSGYENKVRHNLVQRIESMGMKGKIFDVVVPTEEEIEVKDGKRRTVERRVFPGYLLVQMIMSEESW